MSQAQNNSVKKFDNKTQKKSGKTTVFVQSGEKKSGPRNRGRLTPGPEISGPEVKRSTVTTHLYDNKFGLTTQGIRPPGHFVSNFAAGVLQVLDVTTNSLRFTPRGADVKFT